jgi:hypothetical protein
MVKTVTQVKKKKDPSCGDGIFEDIVKFARILSDPIIKIAPAMAFMAFPIHFGYLSCTIVRDSVGLASGRNPNRTLIPIYILVGDGFSESIFFYRCGMGN